MKTLGKNPTVLVVDDDAAVCETVAAVLTSHGYEVLQANSAAQALSILASSPVDLVVLDVEIGDDPGLDVLVDIKKLSPAVRVVMLTGRGYDEETWRTANARGATGYLSKALPPMNLLAEVDRWLKFKQ